ncbi:MAG TPA: aminotransferase class I/II-fold pyridoxal phosphate-dependent enzyme [Candidatus Krumholzibacteria bacterium]|nr:aminotransferase class I/II-fold pyridoxal phosphate-dependent enzyme [Candidatus Krumholzibacteria bacterium]
MAADKPTPGREPGFATICVHGRKHLDKHETGRPIRAVSTPIFQSSTFAFENVEHGAAVFRGEDPSYVYTRLGNPTQTALETELAYLEQGEAALALASGMAAATTAILTCCQAGDHIVAGDTLYGGTHQLFTQTLPRMGITVTEVPADDPANFAAAITDRTKLVYLESPANPTLVLTDIAAVAKIAHERGCLVLVDNTFCTPYLQNPLLLGADIVLHSATKYIGGHGDTVAGILVGKADWILQARMETLRDVGGCISPFNAWLLLRGLKTLPVRMDRHMTNAMEIAQFLSYHPKVAKVIYPGLKTHPQHALAKRQQRGFGGMISFLVEGGREAGRIVMDNVQLCTLAVSLGDVDTLIEHPASMTHSTYSEDELVKVGIDPAMVRLSVGLENVEDIIADLRQALARI